MNPVYYMGWTFFRLAFRFYFGWRVYNPERVPLTGPVILASNHASILDPPLVGAPVRRAINYLARESLFRFPVVGWVLRSWNSVPVDREGSWLVRTFFKQPVETPGQYVSASRRTCIENCTQGYATGWFRDPIMKHRSKGSSSTRHSIKYRLKRSKM